MSGGRGREGEGGRRRERGEREREGERRSIWTAVLKHVEVDGTEEPRDVALRSPKE